MTAHATRPSRSRSRRTVVLIFVLVVLLTAAAAVAWSVVTTDDGSKTARIDDDGFSMSVADARISAPGGVAAEGTVISASSTTVDVSGVAWGAATALRDGLEITLEGDAQPQQPVQLQFEIPDDVQVPDDAVIMVVAKSDSQEKPELLAARWDPESRTVTATTEHFTEFVPAFVEAGKALAGFGRGLEKIFLSRTDQPECFGQDPLEGEASLKVSPLERQDVWPCLSLDGEQLSLDLHNSVPYVWEFSSDPAGDPIVGIEADPSRPTAHTLDGAIVAWAHKYIEGGDGETVVLPQEIATTDFEVSDLPIRGDLDVLPALTMMMVVILVAEEMTPDGFLYPVDLFECLADLGGLAQDDPDWADVTASTLNCLGMFLDGPAGAVLLMISSAPGALAAMVAGPARTIQGYNNIDFDITLDLPATADDLEAGQIHLWEIDDVTGYRSGAPVDSWVMDDGQVGMWPASTTQWVGCDGVVQETTYDLDGDYIRLDTTVALRQGTPEGMSATFEFLVDDVSVDTETVTVGTVGPAVNLDLTGAQELTVKAATDDECSSASLAYGTLLRATVTQASGAEVDTAALVGSWFGPVDQGYRDYDIELELTEDDGVLKGDVYYPQLKCGGTWTQQGTEPGAVLFREEITVNLEGNCAQRVDVELEPTSEGLDISLDPQTPLASSGTAEVTRR